MAPLGLKGDVVKRFCGVLLVLFLSTSVLGAPKKAVMGPKRNLAEESYKKVNLTVVGGLATTAGDYGGSFLVGVGFGVDRTVPLTLGLDSGILFGSGTGLPILVSAKYLIGTAKTQPFVGASVGPVIGIGDPGVGAGVGATTTGVFDAGPGGDGVRLAILFRAGLKMQIADALDFVTQLDLGGLTGIFYVAPMVGIGLNF